MVSPVSPIVIYPSVPGYTDPQAVSWPVRQQCPQGLSVLLPALTRLSEPHIGRGGGLVSPVGAIEIYPSAPRNTHPRGGPARAPAQRLRRGEHAAAPGPSAGRPCPNHASAEGEAWCPRSVPSRSTHPRQETPIRAAFLRARPRRGKHAAAPGPPRRPALSEPRIGRGGSLVSPVGPIQIDRKSTRLNSSHIA